MCICEKYRLHSTSEINANTSSMDTIRTATVRQFSCLYNQFATCCIPSFAIFFYIVQVGYLAIFIKCATAKNNITSPLRSDFNNYKTIRCNMSKRRPVRCLSFITRSCSYSSINTLILATYYWSSSQCCSSSTICVNCGIYSSNYSCGCYPSKKKEKSKISNRRKHNRRRA